MLYRRREAAVPQEKSRAPMAGDVFLRALAEHGVDFFFANPGTDFPPIVEAFSRGRAGQTPLRERVVAELKTTFASRYTKVVSLPEALQLSNIAVYGKRAMIRSSPSSA